MMRKSSFFIGEPSAFFSMPLVSICCSVESVVGRPLVRGDVDLALRSARIAFSWLPA